MTHVKRATAMTPETRAKHRSIPYPTEAMFSLSPVRGIFDYGVTGPRTIGRIPGEDLSVYDPADPEASLLERGKHGDFRSWGEEGRYWELRQKQEEELGPSLSISLYGKQVTEELPNGDLRIGREAVLALLDYLLPNPQNTLSRPADSLPYPEKGWTIELRGVEGQSAKIAHILFFRTTSNL